MNNVQKWLITYLVEQLGKLITPAIVAKGKQFAVCWLKGQVANTENKIDDAVVDIIAQALEVDPNSCPAIPHA
jgi:hypothetical protein